MLVASGESLTGDGAFVQRSLPVDSIFLMNPTTSSASSNWSLTARSLGRFDEGSSQTVISKVVMSYNNILISLGTTSV